MSVTEGILLALVVAVLAFAVGYWLRKVPRAPSATESEARLAEREKRIMRLYQNLEDLMEGFERYVEEEQGQMQRERRDIAALADETRQLLAGAPAGGFALSAAPPYAQNAYQAPAPAPAAPPPPARKARARKAADAPAPKRVELVIGAEDEAPPPPPPRTRREEALEAIFDAPAGRPAARSGPAQPAFASPAVSRVPRLEPVSRVPAAERVSAGERAGAGERAFQERPQAAAAQTSGVARAQGLSPAEPASEPRISQPNWQVMSSAAQDRPVSGRTAKAQRVLALHRQGQDVAAIARQLDLARAEVSLIIELQGSEH